MVYGLRVRSSIGEIIIDGMSRMLRLHATGSLSFSFAAYGEQTRNASFSALDDIPVIVGYFDPFLGNGGWSLTSTSSWLSVKATSASNYTGIYYYYVFRQR